MNKLLVYPFLSRQAWFLYCIVLFNIVIEQPWLRLEPVYYSMIRFLFSALSGVVLLYNLEISCREFLLSRFRDIGIYVRVSSDMYGIKHKEFYIIFYSLTILFLILGSSNQLNTLLLAIQIIFIMAIWTWQMHNSYGRNTGKIPTANFVELSEEDFVAWFNGIVREIEIAMAAYASNKSKKIEDRAQYFQSVAMKWQKDLVQIGNDKSYALSSALVKGSDPAVMLFMRFYEAISRSTYASNFMLNFYNDKVFQEQTASSTAEKKALSEAAPATFRRLRMWTLLIIFVSQFALLFHWLSLALPRK